MKKSNIITVLIIVFISFVIGLFLFNNRNKIITVQGEFMATKDGYYIGPYLLEYREINKYDHNYQSGKYDGKQLRINGKTKTKGGKCPPDHQCRDWSYEVIYDIKSIEEIE